MTAESTRRAVLTSALGGFAGVGGGAAVLALAGCKGITALGPVPDIGSDVVTLEHAIEAEEALVATYRSAMSALSSGAAGRRAVAVITAIHAEHQAHLARLKATLVLPPGHPAPKLAPRPATPPSLPSGSRQLLNTLAAAEHAAAARLTSQLLDVPGPLAQLMASISASEAAHVVALHRAGAA